MQVLTPLQIGRYIYDFAQQQCLSSIAVNDRCRMTLWECDKKQTGCSLSGPLIFPVERNQSSQNSPSCLSLSHTHPAIGQPSAIIWVQTVYSYRSTRPNSLCFLAIFLQPLTVFRSTDSRGTRSHTHPGARK